MIISYAAAEIELAVGIVVGNESFILSSRFLHCGLGVSVGCLPAASCRYFSSVSEWNARIVSMKTQMDGWLEAKALLRALFPLLMHYLFVVHHIRLQRKCSIVKVDRKMIAATYSQST